MRTIMALAAATLLSAVTAHAQTAGEAAAQRFGFTAVENRGQMAPADPAAPDGDQVYGDDNGWYSLVLPHDGGTEMEDNARNFYWPEEGDIIGLRIGEVLDTDKSDFTASQLIAWANRASSIDSPEAAQAKGTDTITDHGVLALASSASLPPFAPFWVISMENDDERARHMVYVMVPTNLGRLEIACFGETEACKTVIGHDLHMGLNAYTY